MSRPEGGDPRWRAQASGHDGLLVPIVLPLVDAFIVPARLSAPRTRLTRHANHRGHYTSRQSPSSHPTCGYEESETEAHGVVGIITDKR